MPIDLAEIDLADEEELIAAAQRARAARAALAREDSAEFAAFALRDEETGGPISNAPFHAEMHDLLAKHDRACFWVHVEGGKTQTITVGRTIHLLGKNPNLRIVIASATGHQASKMLVNVRENIEKNPRVREVFPHLRPGRNWADNSITVARDIISKDPSVQAASLTGRGVVGSRVDHAVFDDALNLLNTRTDKSRKEMERWVTANFEGRLTRRSSIVWLNTAWNKKDAMHERASRKGWVSRRYPVRDRITGRLNWPERWPLERILKQEALFRGPNTPESRRQLYVEAVGDDEQRVEEAWLDRSLAEGMHARVGLVWSLSLEERDAISRAGGVVVLGVDPAAGKRNRNRAGAKTVITVLLVYPDGCRQPLWVEGDTWKVTDVRDKLVDLHARFGGTVFVEDNNVQNWLQEIVVEVSAMPILTLHTGANKFDPHFGVESIGLEMSNGKWLVSARFDAETKRLEPAGELAEFYNDLRSYAPGAHTGDYLMSAWIAVRGATMLLLMSQGGARAS